MSGQYTMEYNDFDGGRSVRMTFDHELLPEVLEEVTRFLRAVSYDYVAGLAIMDEDDVQKQDAAEWAAEGEQSEPTDELGESEEPLL